MKNNLKKEKINPTKVIAKDKVNSEFELTPIVKSLSGILKASPDFDYKKELAKALTKKHLNDE